MSIIIDRRLNGKNKSTVNRQRFMRRYKKHIKKAVSDAVNKRSITDVESGSDISFPKRTCRNPSFIMVRAACTAVFTLATRISSKATDQAP